MSGASPRSFNAGTGPYPGCVETPVSGTDGEQSFFVNSTGIDDDGCPTGGTQVTADWMNGVTFAFNCILTRNGQDPLPDDCLCENPCLIYEKLLEIFDVCAKPDATAAQKSSLDQSTAKVAVCLPDGSTVLIPLNCISGSDSGNGGVDTCPADPDGVVRPVGTTHTSRTGDVSCGDIIVGTPNDNGWGGVWQNNGTQNIGPSSGECSTRIETYWEKTEC